MSNLPKVNTHITIPNMVSYFINFKYLELIKAKSIKLPTCIDSDNLLTNYKFTYKCNFQMEKGIKTTLKTTIFAGF